MTRFNVFIDSARVAVKRARYWLAYGQPFLAKRCIHEDATRLLRLALAEANRLKDAARIALCLRLLGWCKAGIVA